MATNHGLERAFVHYTDGVGHYIVIGVEKFAARLIRGRFFANQEPDDVQLLYAEFVEKNHSGQETTFSPSDLSICREAIKEFDRQGHGYLYRRPE